MVERYVFAKLKPEHATAAGRAEARARARALSGIPGAASVTPGEPADAAALHAWDLSLVVRFSRGEDAAAALGHAAYAAFERYLAETAQVVKAWSFVVEE